MTPSGLSISEFTIVVIEVGIFVGIIVGATLEPLWLSPIVAFVLTMILGYVIYYL